MNRIVLIGNGFDLAHNLKTSYKDFIDDYWEGFMKHCINQDGYNSYGRYQYDCITLIMPKDEEGGLILSDFLPDGENSYETPNKKIISYQALKEKFDAYNNKNKFLSTLIEFNIDNKFLLHLLEKCNREMGWVDIENEYYKFLISKFDTSITNNYSYTTIHELNKDFNYVKEQLEVYLKDLLKKEIKKNPEIKDLIYKSFDINELTEDFKQEVIKLEIEKANKLKEQDILISEQKPEFRKTRNLIYNFPVIDEKLFKSKSKDKGFWKDYVELNPNDFLFLNFNYTDTIDRYHDWINNGEIPSIIDIHGELNNSENPIIFGYGDELEENYQKLENLQDNEYLENIKSIKYQETDNYKQVLSFINSDKYQVIILGHSCGNSDRTLLNTLFEHENCVSIKPYYYQYQDKDNYSDIVRNISRSFTDKKSMRDKVVNKTYTDWFSSDV